MLGLLPQEVPLVPSEDEAREWAERELAQQIYSTEPTLWDRLMQWLSGLWNTLMNLDGTLGPVLLPLIILAIIGAIVAAALLLGGPLRRRTLVRQVRSAVVTDDDARTADQLRAAAEEAARTGAYARAVLERFRAIVRHLDERAILDDRPARTAREAANDAGARLPNCVAELHSGSQLFDATFYGHLAPTAAEYAHLCEIDQHVRAARPARRAAGVT